MKKPFDESPWYRYLEIPDRKRSPVKLEDILAARIEAFMRAKRIKSPRNTKRAEK